MSRPCELYEKPRVFSEEVVVELANNVVADVIAVYNIDSNDGA